VFINDDSGCSASSHSTHISLSKSSFIHNYLYVDNPSATFMYYRVHKLGTMSSIEVVQLFYSQSECLYNI